MPYRDDYEVGFPDDDLGPFTDPLQAPTSPVPWQGGQAPTNGQGIDWQAHKPPVRGSVGTAVKPPAGGQTPMNVEDLSLEQLLQLRARLSEVIAERLAKLGMKLKDSAKITFEPIADPFWSELKEVMTSLGSAPKTADKIVTELKRGGKKYSTLQDAIADAVALAQRSK